MTGRAEKLRPPFHVAGGGEETSAYWVEDADGRRFGYCYFDRTPFSGTAGPSGSRRRRRWPWCGRSRGCRSC